MATNATASWAIPVRSRLIVGSMPLTTPMMSFWTPTTDSGAQRVSTTMSSATEP